MNFSFVCFIVTVALTIGNCDSNQDVVRVKQTVISTKRKLSTPEECARQCQEGEEPKTCYYHFTVEYFATLTRACDLCRSNTTARLEPDCQCITSDGYETSGIITTNRMFPGPAIMVCLNDYVVVDVINRLPGNEITLHWHGIFQKGHQYYDGVPYVTQCPIHEGETFRYQWRAKNSGTHFWHSHTGLQKADGLEGALIVRQPKSTELYNHLWDYDTLDNLIIITDLFHDGAVNHFPGTVDRKDGELPDSFLINGLGQWTWVIPPVKTVANVVSSDKERARHCIIFAFQHGRNTAGANEMISADLGENIDPKTGNTTASPLTNITVKAGHRYRFRMINSCSFMCTVELTIEGHNLTIIATDGAPIKPIIVTTITSSSAERYDFILHTDKNPAQYWIQVRGLGLCASVKLQQLAILSYDSAPNQPELTKPSYDINIESEIVLNPLNVRCDDSSNEANFVCVSQLESAVPVPDEIIKEEPDVRIYLPFGFHQYRMQDIFEPGTYKRFLALPDLVAGLVSNISNIFPSSPYISQRGDIPDEKICSNDKLPGYCQYTSPCECMHVEKIPLNSVLEIILIDEAQELGISHPFHMHGHAFYVIGQGRGIDHNITSINLEEAQELDKTGKMKRNLTRPPAKDTYAVPNNGYSIIRVLATNPGYWLFHCHFMYHHAVGMSVVFQVGEQSDLPPVPSGFPKCHSFVPPIIDSS